MAKMTLGQRVVARRESKGWGPSDLSRKSGVGRSTLHRIESDPTYRPSTRTLQKIADALRCELGDLMPTRAVQQTPLGPVIKEWLDLERLRPVTNPTDDEIEWLESIPVAFWVGMPPTPDLLGALIDVRRRATDQAKK